MVHMGTEDTGTDIEGTGNVPVWHEITGTFTLPAGLAEVRVGRLVIRVLDVTIVDAASTVVVERIRTDVTLTDGQPFEIRVAADDLLADHAYILQVHADRDADGELSAGDLLTTQSYPVDPGAVADSLVVGLTAI